MNKLPEIIDASLIPPGVYCYTRPDPSNPHKIKLCPYWDKDHDRPEHENGYCHFMKQGDWDLGWGLLWDQCKECGINDEIEGEME